MVHPAEQEIYMQTTLEFRPVDKLGQLCANE
jgi:hypothetical protein